MFFKSYPLLFVVHGMHPSVNLELFVRRQNIFCYDVRELTQGWPMIYFYELNNIVMVNKANGTFYAALAFKVMPA
jgi:hypothetical protein